MREKIGVFLGVLLMLSVLLTGCAQGTGGSSAATSGGSVAETAKAQAKITVKMLDVGQGDAILIETGAQTGWWTPATWTSGKSSRPS